MREAQLDWRAREPPGTVPRLGETRALSPRGSAGCSFCAIEYGGGAYWGKNPGMGKACWKPFAGAGGGETGVEGGPQKPRLPLQ